MIVRARKKHRTWGPKKLGAWLKKRYPEVDLPAPSTIGSILKREGLVKPRNRRRKNERMKRRGKEAGAPNDIWAADFKGQFLLGNRRYCYPLTMTDQYSRYLLKCQGLYSVEGRGVFPVFREAFEEYGVPRVIRVDNGAPFGSRGLGGLSELGVWWIKLGIYPEYIEPGHPEQNGRHERMHRTLKAETTRPPQKTLRQQQKRFDVFQQEYNQERPHEALDLNPPASRYKSSPRAYPDPLPAPEYPGHYEVRYVNPAGAIKWKRQAVYLGESFRRQRIGLVEVEEHLWRIYFCDVEVGTLDGRGKKVKIMGSRLSTMCPV